MFSNPPVFYVTNHFKAVVPVLFLFCVALWFILRGASCFEVLPCSLFSYFFIPFIPCDHLAWRRGGWSMCFSCMCLFVLHVSVFVLFLFILVSGVGCCLWLWHSLDVSINFFFQWHQVKEKTDNDMHYKRYKNEKAR